MVTQSLQKSKKGACQPPFSFVVDQVIQSQKEFRQFWIKQQMSQGGDIFYPQ